VDPLFKKYPFYSPYAFSGNRVIDMIELEGLEPEDIISQDGKLSNSVIGLLHGAFLFDRASLQNTCWISSASPKLTLEEAHVYLIAKKPEAITYFEKVIFKNTLKSKSKSFWISLIAHEQNHRNDIDKEGAFWFYRKYGQEGIASGYENIKTEISSFEIEEKYMPLLLKYKNGEILDLFNPEKTSYTDNQKAPLLEKIGADFRVNVILQDEINSNEQQILSYEKEISKLKKSKKVNNHLIQDFEGDIGNLRKKNRNLIYQQDEIKKKYNL
jgi:hypothetical protein